jgi:hypothetical protein
MPAPADWTAAWEAIPAGGRNISLGNDDIIDFKQAVRTWGEVEADYGNLTAGYGDTGRLTQGGARAFFQVAAPATLLKPDGTGHGGDRNGSAALDNGRIFVRHPDLEPWVREQAQVGGAWSDIVANHGGSASHWVSLWPRSFSYVDTGSTDDQQCAVAETREDVAGLSIAYSIPNDGRAYQAIVRAQCTYMVNGANAIGFWLLVDSGGGAGATDRDMKFIYHGTSLHVNSVSLAAIDSSAANGASCVAHVEFAGTTATSANCRINPTEGVAPFPNLGVDFNGEVSSCRLQVEVRPRYLVGSYVL